VVYPEHRGQEYASIQLWRTMKKDPVHLKDLHNDFQRTGELRVKLPTIENGGHATKSAVENGGGATKSAVKLDVVFIQDCTGSMEYHIAKVNDTIKTLMTKVQEDCPGSDVRFAFVGYRDPIGNEDDDDVECIDFLGAKEALPKFQKHLAGIKATGGGDHCEDVLGGLQQAVNLKGWRKDADLKLAFHIADAPTHGDFFTGGMYRDPSLDWVPNFDKNGEDTTNVLKMYCDENIELIHVRITKATDAMIKMYNVLMKRVDPRKEIQTINIEAPTDVPFKEKYKVSAAKMVDVVTQRVSHGLASVVDKQRLSRYQEANAIRIEMKFGLEKLFMSAKRVLDNTPVELTVDFESDECVRNAGPATKMSET